MNLTINYAVVPEVDGLTRQAALSDLFFNYEHPARDALYNKDLDADVSEEDEREALFLDAQDFANTLRWATGVQLDPRELVDDFLRRA
jgi:hypothetical protein